jgi:hypothetical protein
VNFLEWFELPFFDFIELVSTLFVENADIPAGFVLPTGIVIA